MADVEVKVSKRAKSVVVDGVTYVSKSVAIVELAKAGKSKVEISKAVPAHYSMVVSVLKAAKVEAPKAVKTAAVETVPGTEGATVAPTAKKAKAKPARKAKAKAEPIAAVVGDIPEDVRADMIADGLIGADDDVLGDDNVLTDDDEGDIA